MARKEMIAALVSQVSKDGTLGSFDPLGETLAAAVERGLISYSSPDWSLTDAGRAFLAEVDAAKARGRAKARASARARADVMSSLGMRRTRSGAWE